MTPRTSLTDPDLDWSTIPHNVVDGVCVALSDAEGAELAARDAAWAAGAVDRGRDALAARRRQVEAGGVAVAALGFTAATDVAALARLGLAQQAVAAGVAPAMLSIQAADGSFHPIRAADVVVILAAVVGHIEACHAEEAALAGAIAQEADPEAAALAVAWPAAAAPAARAS